MSDLTHLFHKGQKVRYLCKDFDGKTDEIGTVAEVEKDHLIVTILGNVNLWIEQGFNLDTIHTIF